MTDQPQPQPGVPGNSGAWQPVPGGGDYDPDQTMHVSFAAQLPPEPLPGEDPLGAHGPVGESDPATAWSIPVIRDEPESDSGEYSVGAFASSWDQAPSPAAPTPSFPAGMFGQGAAAAQAAREQAGNARQDPGPSGPGDGHYPAEWSQPFTGPEGAEAVPWLPQPPPAAEAAWPSVVDDPRRARDAGAAPEREPAAYRPDDGGRSAGGRPPEPLPEAAPVEAAAARTDTARPAEHAGPAEPAGHAGPAHPAGLDDPAGRTPPPAADAGPEHAGPEAAVGAGAESGVESGVGAGAGAGTGADAGAGTGADTETGAGGAPGAGAEPPPVGGDAPEAAAQEPPEPVEETRSEHPLASYTLRVNGADRPVTDAWLGESLLYVLRERLGLAGAKDGCEQGECGACSVQVDGRLVASCLVPAATAAGSEVRTVEGLTVDGRPSDVQRALAECGAVQCGFCIPGMAMTVHDLLEGNHRPTDLDVRQALSGNLCRCSGYRGVLDAVQHVVAGRGSEDGGPSGDEPVRVPHQGGPGGQEAAV